MHIPPPTHPHKHTRKYPQQLGQGGRAGQDEGARREPQAVRPQHRPRSDLDDRRDAGPRAAAARDPGRQAAVRRQAAAGPQHPGCGCARSHARSGLGAPGWRRGRLLWAALAWGTLERLATPAACVAPASLSPPSTRARGRCPPLRPAPQPATARSSRPRCRCRSPRCPTPPTLLPRRQRCLAPSKWWSSTRVRGGYRGRRLARWRAGCEQTRVLACT